MTAIMFEFPELSAKRLELLRELGPAIRRVLIVYDPQDASPRQSAAKAREAAEALGISLTELQATSRSDIGRAIDQLSEIEALLSIPGGFPSAHWLELIHAANARRVATMVYARDAGTRDAVISYGAKNGDIGRDAARLIEKILRGTNAGDLPIERPTRIELVVNLQSAARIGLTIPPAFLARADEILD
jgi:putative tryptophan/tyrosine transport system substrate-binding protein